ncbi:MAG: hypothetical protein Q8L22_26075 [Reyranella sp.]|nr:hypothetical protein [Reyranella sp.]
MPLHWTIDPERRLMTAVAEGEVTRAEFEAYLDAMGEAGANGYRKLFDGSRGDTRMPAEEILALGVRMRTAHETGPMGPLAVVVPEALAEPLGRVLGMLAAARRPMRVFGEARAARKWISSLPG